MKSYSTIRIFSISLALTLLFSIPLSAQEQQPDWLLDFDTAKSAAAAEGRPILISFSGSDWCVPCMRLERDLFTTSEFLEYSNGHLVLLKLDFPARKKNLLSEEQLKHNEALAEVYNQRGTFPLVILVDPNGNLLGAMEHPLTSTSAYINSISSLVEIANQ